jgi:hypothetical protein
MIRAGEGVRLGLFGIAFHRIASPCHLGGERLVDGAHRGGERSRRVLCLLVMRFCAVSWQFWKIALTGVE